MSTKARSIVTRSARIGALRTILKEARIGIAGCITMLATRCLHPSLPALKGRQTIPLWLLFISTHRVCMVMKAQRSRCRAPPFPTQADIRVLLLLNLSLYSLSTLSTLTSQLSKRSLRSIRSPIRSL